MQVIIICVICLLFEMLNFTMAVQSHRILVGFRCVQKETCSSDFWVGVVGNMILVIGVIYVLISELCK
jgi:hypothetical protein